MVAPIRPFSTLSFIAHLLLCSNHSPFKGTSVYIGINPSNVAITELKMDKDRAALLKKKAEAKNAMQA